MTDTTLTKVIRHFDPATSEQPRQQPQEDQTDPLGSKAQQRQAGSAVQHAAPGRKPLFRS